MIGATLTAVAVAAAAGRAIARRQPLQDIITSGILFSVAALIQWVTP